MPEEGSAARVAIPGRASANASVSAAKRSSGRCIAAATVPRVPDRPVASSTFVEPLWA